MDRAYSAGLAQAAVLWSTPGAAGVESVTAAVTAAVVHSLAEDRCLVEPAPPTPPMTVEDAARLLCELSGHVRLSEPDLDFQQLLDSDAMVTFAWRAANTVGIPAAQLTDANKARELLLAHHRRAAAG